MHIMRYLRSLSPLKAQIISVLLAFVIMVAVGCAFIDQLLRHQLREEAEALINYTQARIASDLLEIETTLSTLTRTINLMILRGSDVDEVLGYMQDITGHVFTDERRITGVIGFYGYFHGAFDENRFLITYDWTEPESFDPTSRSWYQTAAASPGRPVFTSPYPDSDHGRLIISCAHTVVDVGGGLIGVLAQDIELENMSRYIVDTSLAAGGYGLLLNEKLEIIAHPDPSQLGQRLQDMGGASADIANILSEGKPVSEKRMKDHNGSSSIAFYFQLENGWYMGVVTPENAYLQDVYRVALSLTIIGVSLAMALIAGLVRIDAERAKSDEENQQKTKFLAAISHEIRTPMNAILGVTEMQLQNESLDPEVMDAFGKIYSSGDLLLRIINDILDMTKVSVGKMELVVSGYDVASLINDTVRLNLLRHGTKPIEFILDVHPNTPARLLGDAPRIKQILNNLLSNSLKYTEQGKVTLHVFAAKDETGIILKFRIEDTGKGMTQDQITKLFEEYTRFHHDNGRVEGVGLGMAITQDLIHLMKGTLDVKSEPGKGSVFTVGLPQQTVGDAQIGKEVAQNLQKFRHSATMVNQSKHSRMEHGIMPYGSVLVVDDIETNLYVAKGMLRPYELKIDTATSGSEVVHKIKSGAIYDIVFMDHMMPEMDGVEATKLLRDMGYIHPIVALTANAVAGQSEYFLRNGFDAFISKPIDIRRLDEALNKFIREKQLPEVLSAMSSPENLVANPTRPKIQSLEVNPELAKLFIRDAQKTIGVLEKLYKNRFRRGADIQIYIINIHAMKSALANVGEMELSAVAHSLEQAGRERNTETILADTPAFLDELRALTGKLAPTEEGQPIETAHEDKELLNIRLKAVKAACEAYDKRTAKTALASLKEKAWSLETKELLDTLSTYLLHSDFEEAAQAAAKYHEGLYSEIK